MKEPLDAYEFKLPDHNKYETADELIDALEAVVHKARKASKDIKEAWGVDSTNAFFDVPGISDADFEKYMSQIELNITR